MDSFKEKLDDVIIKTFESLRNEKNAVSRLVFPNYANGDKRVSEQELRFVFVENVKSLLEEYGYYYSVETPTKDKYKFSEKGHNVKCESGKGRSANFDLTIKDKERNNIAIIEFKANSASEHEYAKDLCKLWNDKEQGEHRYFINIFKSMDQKTLNTLKEKLSPENNGFLSKKETDICVNVIARSIDHSNESFFFIDCV